MDMNLKNHFMIYNIHVCLKNINSLSLFSLAPTLWLAFRRTQLLNAHH